VWLAVVGCGLVEMFRELHTAHNATAQHHSQQQPTQPGRTPQALGHGLLVMMGIMMTETC